MIKVLIVDDEPMIREGIKTIIDWKKYGYEVCGEAVNGRDGLKKIIELKPDFVISDIKMPGINGIEMIKEAKNENVNLHSILLSGYSEFSYAQEAIKLGVDGYILKPIQKEELIDMIITIREVVEEERQDEKKKQMFVRETFLSTVFSQPNDTIDMRKELKAYEWEMKANTFQTILCTILGKRENSYEIYKFIEYTLAKKYNVLMKIQEDCAELLIMDKIFSKESKGITLLIQHIKSEYKGEVFFVLGEPVYSIYDIQKSYKEVSDLIKHRFVLQDVYNPVTISEHSFTAVKETIVEYINEELINDLYMAVNLNCEEQIREKMMQICELILKGYFSENIIKSFCINLYFRIISNTLSTNDELKELLHADSEYIVNIYSKESLIDLREYLTGILIKFANEISVHKPIKIIDKIVDYIDHNYGNEIKLDTFSYMFFYSSSYLGKLFKSITGNSFNTYIDTVRIQRAKRFIEEGYKIYEVSKMVGYSDKDYFSEKFKKYVGISPSIYKSQHNLLNRNDGNE